MNIRKAGYNRAAPKRSLETGRDIPRLRGQLSPNHYRARFGTVMTVAQIAASPATLTAQSGSSLNRKERRALASKRGA